MKNKRQHFRLTTPDDMNIEIMIAGWSNKQEVYEALVKQAIKGGKRKLIELVTVSRKLG